MKDFQVGYARVNINPPLGSALFGYYVKRLARGYLDDLEAFAIALCKNDKKFLIIGSLNAVTYKEIFPLIMQNKIWLGYGFNGGNAYFSLPGNEGKNFAKGVYDTKTNLVKFRNLHWFTNLDVKKRHENIRLMYSYEKNPEKYPKYDNFDAIEVSKTLEIPKDYFGVMGVPISFLNEYNPEQFEIVGVANHGKDNEYDLFSPSVNGKNIFKRILIRRKVAD